MRACDAVGTGEVTWHGQLRQSSQWTLKYSDGHGRSLYQATKTTDWSKALKVKKNKFREVMGGALPWEPPAQTTLAQVLELVIAHYVKNKKRSLPRQRLALRRILEFPAFLKGAIAAVLVTSTLVEDGYVLFRQGAGAANGTINRELALLRQAFKLAHRRLDERGRALVDRVPSIELLDEAKPRDITIAQSEYESIHRQLRLTAPDVADLVEHYRLTGWRNKEVRQLEWTDVNWFNQTIRLRSVVTKSGEAFELPFADDPDLHALLKRRRRLADEVERVTGRLVPHVYFRRGRCGRIGKRTSLSSGKPIGAFTKEWNAALDAAGMAVSGPLKKRPHDFRRAAAEETLEVETDLQTAANAVGWNSIQSLLRYRRGNKKAVARAVKERALLREELKARAQMALKFGRGGGKDEG